MKKNYLFIVLILGLYACDNESRDAGLHDAQIIQKEILTGEAGALAAVNDFIRVMNDSPATRSAVTVRTGAITRKNASEYSGRLSAATLARSFRTCRIARRHSGEQGYGRVVYRLQGEL